METKTPFTEVNGSFINLKTVSNINPLPHRNRIVYNFSYPILLSNKGENKIISDYQYDDYQTSFEFEAAVAKLSVNGYILENYIQQDKGYINKERISSFKVQPERLRVIFNMSHSIEIESRKGNTIAPEFVYVHFSTDKDYENYIDYLNKYLV